MAVNENVNKVVYGNSTLIDLTNDTVTSETLVSGYTAHDRSGATVTGTLELPSSSTPLEIEKGGTNANNASGARTNLSVYSKVETDSAISQSTATLNLNFVANDDTWSEIYTILSEMSNLKSAFFMAQGVPAGVLTGGKYTNALKGMVNRAANGVYDFIAFTGYQPQYIWVWRISGFTSGSVTPTVSAIYRFTGTAI